MEALSLVASVGSVITIVSRSITSLNKARIKFSKSDLSVELVVGQLHTVRTALNQVQAFLKEFPSFDDCHEEFLKDLYVAVEHCKLLVQHIDDQINRLEWLPEDILHTRPLLAERVLRDNMMLLNNQISALNLCLTAFRCRLTSPSDEPFKRELERYREQQLTEGTASSKVSADLMSFPPPSKPGPTMRFTPEIIRDKTSDSLMPKSETRDVKKDGNKAIERPEASATKVSQTRTDSAIPRARKAVTIKKQPLAELPPSALEDSSAAQNQHHSLDLTTTEEVADHFQSNETSRDGHVNLSISLQAEDSVDDTDARLQQHLEILEPDASLAVGVRDPLALHTEQDASSQDFISPAQLQDFALPQNSEETESIASLACPTLTYDASTTNSDDLAETTSLLAIKFAEAILGDLEFSKLVKDALLVVPYEPFDTEVRRLVLDYAAHLRNEAISLDQRNASRIVIKELDTITITLRTALDPSEAARKEALSFLSAQNAAKAGVIEDFLTSLTRLPPGADHESKPGDIPETHELVDEELMLRFEAVKPFLLDGRPFKDLKEGLHRFVLSKAAAPPSETADNIISHESFWVSAESESYKTAAHTAANNSESTKCKDTELVAGSVNNASQSSALPQFVRSYNSPLHRLHPSWEHLEEMCVNTSNIQNADPTEILNSSVRPVQKLQGNPHLMDPHPEFRSSPDRRPSDMYEAILQEQQSPSDRLKCTLERFVGQRLVWWPLAEPLRLSRPGTIRSAFFCNCGTKIVFDFPCDVSRTTLNSSGNISVPVDPNMLPLYAVDSLSRGSSTATITTPKGYAARFPQLRSQGQSSGPSTSQAQSQTPKVHSDGLTEGEWFYYCIERSDTGVKVVEHNLREQSSRPSQHQTPPDTLFAQSLQQVYAEATSWWFRFFTMTSCYSGSLIKFQYLVIGDTSARGLCLPTDILPDELEYNYKRARPTFIEHSAAIESLIAHRIEAHSDTSWLRCFSSKRNCDLRQGICSSSPLPFIPNRKPLRLPREAGTEGYGLRIVTRMAFMKLVAMLFIYSIPSWAFLIYWLTGHPDDLQTAAAPFGISLVYFVIHFSLVSWIHQPKSKTE